MSAESPVVYNAGVIRGILYLSHCANSIKVKQRKDLPLRTQKQFMGRRANADIKNNKIIKY